MTSSSYSAALAVLRSLQRIGGSAVMILAYVVAADLSPRSEPRSHSRPHSGVHESGTVCWAGCRGRRDPGFGESAVVFLVVAAIWRVIAFSHQLNLALLYKVSGRDYVNRHWTDIKHV
ncbi:hypothetical protein BJX61DRAFT_501573 [Aspergillus egyptiacus]|nr:hypothetical protein BJX61DRAFT_501573 [Aspergillus egyptiacus]